MLGVDARAARVTWTVLLILLGCWIVYSIAHTLFIFVVSLLFAYLLLPLVDLIDRLLPMKRSRAPALAIVYTALILLLVFGVFQVTVSAAEEARLLAQKIGEYWHPGQPVPLPLPQSLKPFGERIAVLLHDQLELHIQEILSNLPRFSVRALGAAANLAFLVIVPILSFFFLKDGRALQRSILKAVSDEGHRGLLTEIIADMNVLLAQYMRALVLLGLAAFFCYATFFTILGVQYGMLMAAIAFPLEFFPMVGPLTSSVMVVTVAALTGSGPLWLIIVFLVCFRVLQDYFLSPHLMSAGMELHPLLVIFGVFAGQQLAGIAGAFLSVPVLATLRIVYRRIVGARVEGEMAAGLKVR